MTATLTDWAERLAAELKQSEQEYLHLRELALGLIRADDIVNEDELELDFDANATLQAALHLMKVVNALRELEPFSGNERLAPLHDIATAMMELDRGQRPRLLQPRAGVGRGGDGVARKYVVVHAVLCVRLLREIGESQAQACRDVARIFAKAGLKGRKQGGKLSPKTVDDWTTRLDPDGEKFLGKMFANIQTWPGRPWNKIQVINIIEEMAVHPLIKSKI